MVFPNLFGFASKSILSLCFFCVFVAFLKTFDLKVEVQLLICVVESGFITSIPFN
jgi:hypothetical protein